MVVNCSLEAGVMEYWSIGPSVECIRFYLPTLHPSPEKNLDLRQCSSTPVKKEHPRQIKPDGLFNQQS